MKQISSRFSIAVHTMSMIALRPSLCTGDYIAKSVNTQAAGLFRLFQHTQ
ncbi:Rrf2 family transcriptional regulator [Paenibacillus terrae]